MSNNERELSAREKRAVEARTGSNARVSQRAGSSMPTPEVGATAAPKWRRPDLERNVVVATDNQPKPLQKRHDETRKKTMAWRKAANGLEKVQRETSLLEMTQSDQGVLNLLGVMTRKLAAAKKARDDYMGQIKDLVKQVATLQEVVKTTNNKLGKIDETFAKSEFERKRLQEEVADLKNRLGLRDAGVQRAVEKAIKYEDRIGQANRKIKMINDTLRVNIVLLGEVRSNIELVGLLKKGEVPHLDAELVALKKQEAGLLSATDEFAFHMGKLEDILKDPSAGGTESRVVDAEANAVPVSSSSGPSGDEDSSSSTTGGPP
ncbi:hypothetical protein AALP_AA7G144400 [Arabis alpina]|uniref:Uncharacterized protein n=1 Tax=Arabis alpina TaxID=50452 RepID=A0A087GI14_ARAAL|nr:hypothetical protein AALP_AA7G144400 [Arabis alpina]